MIFTFMFSLVVPYKVCGVLTRAKCIFELHERLQEVICMGPDGYSALAAWLYCRMGFMKLGPAPSTHFFAARLMPIVLCAGGALYFGNVAYLSLSVAFIQILKVSGAFLRHMQCTT